MSSIAPEKWSAIKQELNAYSMVELASRHGVTVGEIALQMREDGVSRKPITQGSQTSTSASTSDSATATATADGKTRRRTRSSVKKPAASADSASSAQSAPDVASTEAPSDSSKKSSKATRTAKPKSDSGEVMVNGIACRPNTRDAVIAEQIDKLGKISDPDFAQLVGVSPRVVGAFRRRHGIDPFQLDYSASSAKGGKSAPSGGRPSKIEPYAELLGTVPDSVVADKAGVSVNAVSNYRRRRDIAAFDPTSAPGAPPAATGRKPSKIDPYSDELGTVPDRVIADKAGVSINAVSNYRRRRGIAPFDPNAAQAELAISKPDAVPAPAAQAPAAAKAPAAPQAAAEAQPAEAQPAAKAARPRATKAAAPSVGMRVYTVTLADGSTSYAVGSSLLDAATRIDGIPGVVGIAYLGDLLG